MLSETLSRVRSHGPLRGLTKLCLLLVTAALLGLSLWLQARFFAQAREFYFNAAGGSSLTSGGGPEPMSGLANCDVETYIQELARRPNGTGVKIGACDLFMYNGGVAVSNFLVFLELYLAFLLGSFVLVGMLPARWRKAGTLLCSLLFVGFALPLRPALWILELVVLLYALLCLPFGPRVRAGLIGLAACAFYGTAGHTMIDACTTEYLSASRIYLSEQNLQWIQEHLHLTTAELNAWTAALHLGAFGQPRLHDQGCPVLFLMLAFLLKQFRRVLWLVYEVGSGRLLDCAPLDFALYFVGLPTLVGNAATTPLRTYADKYTLDPGVTMRGARTIAACMGLATVLYVLVAMTGYSPAVRILFPRCDVDTAGPLTIWAKLATQYVVQFLFLLITEQGSLGVARLFGFEVHDNYEQPFLAHNVAEFWRRWNIYFREYHVAITFLPVALWLARRDGEQRRWHLAVAGAVTFLGTFVLNILPLALLAGTADFHWNVTGEHQTGYAALAQELAHVGGWRDLVPSLALYYLLEGVAVSVSLMVEFRRPRMETRRLRGRALALRLAGIVATFLFVAGARCFLDSTLTFTQQWHLIVRALGLYHWLL
jgi:hypothetical protein